ncbi:uncharacterized protein LOC142520115 [Primulina tabacum]|uniref:uncharacterized protein LOC142520115 n=1 Tax=Primulina tabacum TaxID=48773 RepID=UPI003F59E2CA
MKEKVLETDEILKASKSTTDAGEKGSICEEPKHQKLKLLVAERENKELLKRKLELECELDAKKMRIEELTTKLEENFDEIDGLQDLNQQLFTKERLSNNELQNVRKALIKVLSEMSDDR